MLTKEASKWMGERMGASLPPFTVCWVLCDLVSQDFKDRTEMVPVSVKAFPNRWLAFLAQVGRDLNTSQSMPGSQ